MDCKKKKRNLLCTRYSSIIHHCASERAGRVRFEAGGAARPPTPPQVRRQLQSADTTKLCMAPRAVIRTHHFRANLQSEMIRTGTIRNSRMLTFIYHRQSTGRDGDIERLRYIYVILRGTGGKCEREQRSKSCLLSYRRPH